MSYADFFKSLIRQCAEYAVANGIEINHFIKTVTNNLSNFVDNWIVSEDPTKPEPNPDDIKRFIVQYKYTAPEDDPPSLYELFK